MSQFILGVRIDFTSYAIAAQQVNSWSKLSQSRIVYAANVHMLMEAHDSLDFRMLINAADLVTPDGMPLVWMMRLKGHPEQQRVYGPTLMLHVLEMAEKENIPVGFYGADPITLQSLLRNLRDRFPGLNVVYSFSPPFVKLDESKSAHVIKEVVDSGAHILFVGLGCPKQELWIAEYKGKIPAVMLGVGAAFDFHAGIKSQAPVWMQNAGLEWLYRLWLEPRRLWRRYLYNNPRFILLAMSDLGNYFLHK